MPSRAAALRQELESQLARRIPAALSPMVRPTALRQPLADSHLNHLLGGGIPEAAITEVYGAACSGRTSFALSLAAAVTHAGTVVAWIDASDTLDPETAALCGVDLEQLLWIRCGAPAANTAKISSPSSTGTASGTGQALTEAMPTHAAAAPDSAVSRPNHASVDPSQAVSSQAAPAPAPNHATAAFNQAATPNLVAAGHTPRPVGNGGCGSPHPRGEGRGMPQAIDSLLQSQPRSAALKQRRAQKSIGTPGAPNRNLTALPRHTGCHSESQHAAMVQAAATFPAGHTASGSPGPSSSIVQPGNIVPTGGNLFGRDVRRAPMPFPNASPYREEQIPTDRQPPRRPTPQGASKKPAPSSSPETPNTKSPLAPQPHAAHSPGISKPPVLARDDAAPDHWKLLDQALRAVDLLLQAGGFSLLVLDLGSIPANVAWRIPMATWFRFRAGCERSRSSLLVLSQHGCARAGADLTVTTELTGVPAAGGTVSTGAAFTLRVEQQRRSVHQGDAGARVVPFARKPVRSDGGGAWPAASPWSVRA